MHEFVEGEFDVIVVDSNEAPMLGYDISILPLALDNIRFVNENSDIYTLIGKSIPAYDPDLEQSLTFSIVNQRDEVSLNINRCSGQLEVGSLINFESHSNFSITIRVEDDHTFPLHDEINIQIYVMDVNEPPILMTKYIYLNESIWSSRRARILSNSGIIVGHIEDDNSTIYTISHENVGEDPYYDIRRYWVRLQSANDDVQYGPFKVITTPPPTLYNLSIRVDVNAGQKFNPDKIKDGFVVHYFDSTTQNDKVGDPLNIYDPDNDRILNIPISSDKQSFNASLRNHNEYFRLNESSLQLYAMGPYFDFEKVKFYKLEIRINDDGIVSRWENNLDFPVLTQASTTNLYVSSFIDIRILNVKESPLCPTMVESRSFTVLENSVEGTSFGKYEARMIDQALDTEFDTIINYKISNSNNITGRLFMETSHPLGCNLTDGDLLLNGMFEHVLMKDACRRKCEYDIKCKSWEYNASSCRLYSVVASCASNATSCWVYDNEEMHIASPVLSNNVICGTLRSWHVRQKRRINGTILTSYGSTIIQNRSVCATKCAVLFERCLAWDFNPKRLESEMSNNCVLYSTLDGFLPSFDTVAGYFIKPETTHGNIFRIDTLTGNLQVADTASSPGRLDFESYNVYIFSITAQAYGKSPLLFCEGVTAVYVQDVNEPITLFKSIFFLSEKMIYGKVYEENGLGPQNNGIQINEIPMVILGFDADRTSSLVYSVSGGPFGISECETCVNGQLYLIGDSLDYETKSAYNLIIKVIDIGTPTYVVETSVKIQVQNEFEKPKIYGVNDQRYIYENSNIGDVVLGPAITCIDPDPFEDITWYVPNTGVVLSTDMNPCGMNLKRKCTDWPKKYLTVKALPTTSNMFSTNLVIDTEGTSIDFENEKSFSILIRVRDR